eukprot:NODE_6801_length_606_cov_3.391382_g5814_i0.p1 GENE.NODE_6801_length_606_cov_3.391382_g5814_i0~~NODE_6801_length_606_cov_3.391382_g5814_i0.p1  ORF type:complete len:64 (-),score=9.73 NODE_6801_length_606_cov_3.391382_g5814_i0:251-442(-)
MFANFPTPEWVDQWPEAFKQLAKGIPLVAKPPTPAAILAEAKKAALPAGILPGVPWEVCQGQS